MSGPLRVLGTGRVAAALVRALADRRPLGLWGRDHAAALALAEGRAGVHAFRDLADLLTDGAGPLLLAVADPALAELAGRLASDLGPGDVVLHLAGFHDVELLAPLAGRGVAVGVLHPNAAVGPDAGAEAFAGVVFGVSGDDAARAAARELATELGGRVLELPPGARPTVHAAASLLANGTVGLFAEAEALLAEALDGSQAEVARALLLGLLRSSLANLERLPTVQALTGPVARGDADVVAGQLAALGSSGEPRRAALLAELVTAMERLLASERQGAGPDGSADGPSRGELGGSPEDRASGDPRRDPGPEGTA